MRNHPSSSMQMAELKIILSCCILQVRAKIKEVKTCTVVSWLQGTRYILKMKPQVCNAMDMNLCKLRASFKHTNLPSHHTHTYFTFTYTFKHQRRGVNIFHCCVLLCKSCKCAPKVYLTSPLRLIVLTSLHSKSWDSLIIPRSSVFEMQGLMFTSVLLHWLPCTPARHRMCHLFKSPGKSIRDLASNIGWWWDRARALVTWARTSWFCQKSLYHFPNLEPT